MSHATKLQSHIHSVRAMTMEEVFELNFANVNGNARAALNKEENDHVVHETEMIKGLFPVFMPENHLKAPKSLRPESPTRTCLVHADTCAAVAPTV